MIKQSDRNIVRVKTAVNVSADGKYNKGNVTIVILPKCINSAGDYFEYIRQNILQQLYKKAPAVLINSSKLQIREVQYIEFSVSVKAVVENYNDYQEVYDEVEKRLEKFFNPITGNTDLKGFEIGELPTKVKIYNFLKSINKIKDIQSLNIECYEVEKEQKKEIDFYKALELPYAVAINGVHNIEIEII